MILTHILAAIAGAVVGIIVTVVIVTRLPYTEGDGDEPKNRT